MIGRDIKKLRHALAGERLGIIILNPVTNAVIEKIAARLRITRRHIHHVAAKMQQT
ncbi:Uncharacterised protein [Shigella sonnei]|nr:Uncharacterised protein [Shigella sonnei]